MATDQGSVTGRRAQPDLRPRPQADDLLLREPRGHLTCTAASRRGSATARRTSGPPPPVRTPPTPRASASATSPTCPTRAPVRRRFFYTNQQSARLMFYHDHAWGITRLNVYAGEAARLPGHRRRPSRSPDRAGGAPLAGMGTGTPLDHPGQDLRARPGHHGQARPDLELRQVGRRGQPLDTARLHARPEPRRRFGHERLRTLDVRPVVLAAGEGRQVPADRQPLLRPDLRPGRRRPFCEPQQIPSTPNVSVGMEAFNDTPIVNGTAYPTTTVDPKAYRYRILNAANDRFWNLQWYVADPTTGTLSEVALNPNGSRRGPARPERRRRRRTPATARPDRTGSRSAPRAGSCRPRPSSRPSRSPGSPIRPGSTSATSTSIPCCWRRPNGPTSSSTSRSTAARR